MVARAPSLVAVILLACAVGLTTCLEGLPGLEARPQVTPPSPDAPWQIVETNRAAVVMPAGSPLELSGLTWAGGNLFYAVSDSDPSVHPFAIDIDHADGRVRAIDRRAPVVLSDPDGRPSRGRDLEGVAFDPDGPTLAVVDEDGLWTPRGSILIYRASDGRQVDTIDMRGTHFEAGRVRGGLGLESLARRGTTTWTANEEALRGDGPRSNREHGTFVRLTRFDEGRLTGQWAYRTAPTGGAVPYVNVHASGVADLAVLADGRLLVLERATSGRADREPLGGFISRIYLVDTRTGSNVMGMAELPPTPGSDVRPVRKQLLWSRLFPLTGGPANFEGLAVGPMLADGSRSLLLVSDNEHVPSSLWALRLGQATATRSTE